MKTVLRLVLIAALGAALGAVVFALIPHSGQTGAPAPPRGRESVSLRN